MFAIKTYITPIQAPTKPEKIIKGLPAINMVVNITKPRGAPITKPIMVPIQPEKIIKGRPAINEIVNVPQKMIEYQMKFQGHTIKS